MDAQLRSYVQALALALAACGKHGADGITVTAEGTSGSGETLTYSDDAPADAVLAAIAKANQDPLEIRDKDGAVCTRRRRPTQNKPSNVVLSVRVSATEWITKLTQVDEENLIEAPFDQFANIVDVYKRSALDIFDAEIAAQPGTLASTLTPALRTLCASFPSIYAVRADELQARPTFGDTNTQPPAPRPSNLAIGTPVVDGPMTPAIVRQFLVHEAALFGACKQTATITFTITPEAKTTDVVADPCLANALGAIHFPAPPAPVRVTAALKYAAPP